MDGLAPLACDVVQGASCKAARVILYYPSQIDMSDRTHAEGVKPRRSIGSRKSLLRGGQHANIMPLSEMPQHIYMISIQVLYKGRS